MQLFGFASQDLVGQARSLLELDAQLTLLTSVLLDSRLGCVHCFLELELSLLLPRNLVVKTLEFNFERLDFTFFLLEVALVLLAPKSKFLLRARTPAKSHHGRQRMLWRKGAKR